MPKRCERCGRTNGAIRWNICSSCANGRTGVQRETADQYMASRKFTGRERELAMSVYAVLMAPDGRTADDVVEARADKLGLDQRRVCNIMAAGLLMAQEAGFRYPPPKPREPRVPSGTNFGNYVDTPAAPGETKYPWADMAPGDSFWVPAVPNKRTSSTLKKCARYREERHGGSFQVERHGDRVVVICLEPT